MALDEVRDVLHDVNRGLPPQHPGLSREVFCLGAARIALEQLDRATERLRDLEDGVSLCLTKRVSVAATLPAHEDDPPREVLHIGESPPLSTWFDDGKRLAAQELLLEPCDHRRVLAVAALARPERIVEVADGVRQLVPPP